MQPHDKTCDAIQALIDDLSQTQLHDMHLPKSITDHVRTCETCKLYLDQMLALADRLAAWDVPEPKKPISTGVMARIAQFERDHRFNLQDLGRQCVDLLTFRVRMPAALAAVLILGLFISIAFNVTARHPADSHRTVTIAESSQDNSNSSPFLQPVVQNTSSPSDVRVVQSVPELQSLLSRSLPAPSTFVIILGAPPFPLSQEGWLTQPVDTSGIGTQGTGTSGVNLSPRDTPGTRL